MTKTEAIAVGFIAGILCPLLLFVLGWWSAVILAAFLPVSEHWIAAAAFGGLAVGMGLDVLYLKKWISCFYSVDVKWLVPVYLFCSAIAAAFFMGLPIGNIILGTLAGGYIGRRAYHTAQSQASFSRTARRMGIFTALVTGAWALLAGLLALNEGTVTDWLQAVTGLSRMVVTGPVGVGLVVGLCIVLMIVQYWCTRVGAWIMFRLEGVKRA